MRDPPTCSVEFDDGSVVSAELTVPFPATSRVARYDYLADDLVVRATTERGDVVEFEVAPPGADSRGLVAGRPVVYLDQNQWSAVSNAVHGTGRTAGPDVDAAMRLVELARDRAVLLPVSAGHLMETGQWRDPERRYHLGLTVADLSRGWQMRDPTSVRRGELTALFRGRLGQPRGEEPAAVVTLDPDVVFAETGFAVDGSAQPEPWMRALMWITSTIDMLLDADDTPPGPDRGWAAAQQMFTDELHAGATATVVKRRSIDEWLMKDLRHDVDVAAHGARMTASQVEAWLAVGPGPELAELPSLAWYREVVHARHLDPGTRWKQNDLIDSLFLSCAAGYADVVVCERHLAEPLRQAARRLGRLNRAFARLRDAVPVVEELVGSAGN